MHLRQIERDLDNDLNSDIKTVNLNSNLQIPIIPNYFDFTKSNKNVYFFVENYTTAILSIMNNKKSTT